MQKWLRRWFLTARLRTVFWGKTPQHPLFVVRFRHLPPIRRYPEWVNSVLVTGGGTLLCISTVYIPFMSVILALLLAIAILCIPLGGTLRGFIIAGEVARGIALEGQDPARMSLFQMMPPGQLGISWLLGVRSVRLSRRYRLFSLVISVAQGIVGAFFILILGISILSLFRWYGEIVLIFSIFVLILLFLVILGMGRLIAAGALAVVLTIAVLLSLQFVDIADIFTVLMIVTFGVSVIVWLAADNLQAPVLGLVCGLWGATVSTRVMVAWMAAVGVYLSIIVGCGIVFALIIGFAGQFFTNDAVIVWANIIASIFTPLLGIALREFAVRQMWAWVCRRMNASGREVLMV